MRPLLLNLVLANVGRLEPEPLWVFIHHPHVVGGIIPPEVNAETGLRAVPDLCAFEDSGQNVTFGAAARLRPRDERGSAPARLESPGLFAWVSFCFLCLAHLQGVFRRWLRAVVRADSSLFNARLIFRGLVEKGRRFQGPPRCLPR
jgi:hypothetical protein